MRGGGGPPVRSGPVRRPLPVSNTGKKGGLRVPGLFIFNGGNGDGLGEACTSSALVRSIKGLWWECRVKGLYKAGLRKAGQEKPRVTRKMG